MSFFQTIGWLIAVAFAVWVILNILTLREKLKKMATREDLDQAITDLGKEINKAADRVIAKLSSLTPETPNFDSEVATIVKEMEAMKNIAPNTAETSTADTSTTTATI